MSNPPRWTDWARVTDLEHAQVNPKDHDPDALARSIGEFGYIEPVVVDERTGRLLAGHGRTELLVAGSALGLEPPDGVMVDSDGTWLVLVVHGAASRDDDHAHAMGVALNRVGERGGWKVDELTELMDDLAGTSVIDAVGFDQADLDELIKQAGVALPPPPEPEVPPAPRQIAERVKSGELWALGPHRLLCGDGRVPADVERILDGRAVNLAVTSPPYAEQRDYDEASGFRPIKPADYVAWFDAVQANIANVIAVDGSWLINIKPSADTLETSLYVHDLVAAHVRRWGWHFATELCWERPGVPKQPVLRLKNAFEPIYQFTRGRWKFCPKNVMHATSGAIVPLGPGSGNTSWADTGATNPNATRQGDQSGDWFKGRYVEGAAYPSNRLPTFTGSHEATGHPAAFPVGLVEFLTRLYTDEGDVVFDPFVGSGSSILAAHRTDRVGFGIELSPGYCDVIVDRWERHTGIDAVRID